MNETLLRRFDLSLLAAGVGGDDHGKVGYIAPVPDHHANVVCSLMQDTRSKGFEGRPGGIALVIGHINIIGPLPEG